VGLNRASDATWGRIAPFLSAGRVQALNLLQRPPDRLVGGLRHRHDQSRFDRLDNDALEEVRLCLIADLVLVAATMEANRSDA
jgi:hypothetical protein